MPEDLHQQASLQPAHPVMLRPCGECNSPMLLMSALFQNSGRVSKLYECFACKKTEEVMTSPQDV